MAQPDLKAVIFDLDGILTDTSIYHARAWAELVRGLGYEPPEDLEERVKGISRMASLRIALGDHADEYSEEQLQELAAKKNARYQEAIEDVGPDDLFPGALALFDDLERAGIKVVIGSASKNTMTVVERLGIADRLDAVSDGYSHTHPKPHPEVFLVAAERAGARPEECIVVEDAEAGVTAALRGGFTAVGMGTYESLKHAHLFVESLEELSAERLKELHAQVQGDG